MQLLDLNSERELNKAIKKENKDSIKAG